MVVCKCRDIREEDYTTEAELKERIMKPDFNCGQCQMRYLMVDTQPNTQYNTKTQSTAT